jgi:hypothetical protein
MNTSTNVHTLLHVALALISKQEHLLMTAHAVKTVQSERHRSICGNGLFAYRPTAALIGYGALVCEEYMPVSCLSMQLNSTPTHSAYSKSLV